MRPQDMNRFQATIASLAEVFGKQLSPPLTDIYWNALKGLAVEQLQESSDSWIKHGKHFPKPAELLDRYKEMVAAAPKVPIAPPPPYRKWLALVNGMFLRYLLKRRYDDGFQGCINIPERRRECLSLVTFFEDIEAEGDEEATEAQLKIRFDRAMERIPDSVREAA